MSKTNRDSIEQSIQWAEADSIVDQEELAQVCHDARSALHALLGEAHWITTQPPHVTIDGNGGLWCEWRGDTRDLVVRVAYTGQVKLYRVTAPISEPVTSENVLSPTPTDLADAWQWFSSAITEETAC